jgi:hypothetical protein
MAMTEDQLEQETLDGLAYVGYRVLQGVDIARLPETEAIFDEVSL